MAVISLSYCNAALGKQITFDFDNSSKVISNVVVGAACSSPQPSVIYYDYGPFGLAFQGYVYPMNVAPYAYYVAIGGDSGCSLAFGSNSVVNASNNLTADGSITINVTGKNLYTKYSIDGGATFVLDATTPNANIFTNLLPGSYNVVVVTQGIIGGLCTINTVVVVGYDAVVCDLELGTITTESASGANGKIKILNVLGYPAPVEYRLGAGAWQDSAEFSGLTAATYNVQVRYKAFPSCNDSRNVVVAETGSCDLAILDVQIVHEQLKYTDDGVIFIIVDTSHEPVLYSIDDGATYQASPYFIGLSPGLYQVKVVDDNGCIDDREVEVLRYREPTVVYPVVNSLRAVVTSGPMVKTRQNFDNTLFANMRFAGVDCNCYNEKVEISDSLTQQFRSNYGTNTVKVYNEAGTLINTLTPVKKTSNLDKVETINALFANAGAGQTQIFFENGIPLFIEVGQDITIAGEPTLNGIYEIKDRKAGIGDAEGYEVLIVDQNYTAPGLTSGTVTVEYDLEPYEVWEFSIIASLYGSGVFYFVIEGIDPQFTPYVISGEPFEIAALWKDHLQIKFKSYDNCKQITYDTGIEHTIRIKGELTRPTFPAERTVYTDSKDRLKKIESYVRQVFEMNMYELPFYLIAKFALAQDSDYLEIDGVEYQTEENIEPEHFQNDALSNVKTKVRQVDFAGDNSDDQGANNGADILGDNDTVLGVP